MAELHGLGADRELHIESAWMGHDVRDAGDLSDSQDDVRRYSMKAPGDFIGVSQYTHAGDNVGHGADPDDFDGTTRLDTGDKTDGTPNTGLGSLSAVFENGSDAWNNMDEVFTAGTVQTYRSPHYEHVSTGRTVTSYQDGWDDAGESVDIP